MSTCYRFSVNPGSNDIIVVTLTTSFGQSALNLSCVPFRRLVALLFVHEHIVYTNMPTTHPRPVYGHRPDTSHSPRIAIIIISVVVSIPALVGLGVYLWHRRQKRKLIASEASSGARNPQGQLSTECSKEEPPPPYSQ
jgi:hypothetical protein